MSLLERNRMKYEEELPKRWLSNGTRNRASMTVPEVYDELGKDLLRAMQQDSERRPRRQRPSFWNALCGAGGAWVDGAGDVFGKPRGAI